MIEKIEDKFEARGFHFKQLKRDGMVCLYELNKPEWKKPSYEVIVLKEVKETIWPNGSKSPPREIYPGPNSWGDLGWTLTTKEQANIKFAAVSKEQAEQSGLPKKRGRKKLK